MPNTGQGKFEINRIDFIGIGLFIIAIMGLVLFLLSLAWKDLKHHSVILATGRFHLPVLNSFCRRYQFQYRQAADLESLVRKILVMR